MKRIFIVILILFFSYNLFAQFTATGTCMVYNKKYSGIDYLFVFNGIGAQSAIVYNGPNASTVKWARFDSPDTPLILQTPNENYNIEDGTGYLVTIDGESKPVSIWVIDYQKYLPVLTALSTNAAAAGQCDELIFNVSSTVPVLTYKTPDGIIRAINRVFNLKYNTLEWSGSEWSKEKEVTAEFILPATKLTVNQLPLCDTKFELSGDNFMTDLGLTPVKVESNTYNAVKTECHILSKATTRSELNEAERPEKDDVTTASAPLEIVFTSNANVPVTEFYEWRIFRDKSLLFTRNDQDLRFKFTDAGNYTVKLTVNNTYNCQDSGSVAIKIVESALEVPGAFSPNGDGINDEFRVGYKSLAEFKCWVFNRWQQKVFFWTDPQKGWDGRINGKPATEGAYFYVIEATGTDGANHDKKGCINLLRGKQP